VAGLAPVRPTLRFVQEKRIRTGRVVFLAILATCVVVLAASDCVRFVVFSMADYLVYGFPNESDRAEADAIIDEVATVYAFTHNSLSQPARAPVFAAVGSKRILSRPTEITVYDVQDRVEQDRIAEALKQFSMRRKLKPFRVCFYDHENWQLSGNSGQRGSETQLRCIGILSDRVRDIAGQKPITYPVP
jgi:hypothetical protein